MFAPTAHTKTGKKIVERLKEDWDNLDFKVDDEDSPFFFRNILSYSQQTELSRRRIIVSAGHPKIVRGSTTLRAYVDRIKENTVYAHYW